MTTADRFVIIGAGLAGAKAAEALREKGFSGIVTLLGDETHRPYERPPLSKAYLAGAGNRPDPFVHEPGWYADHDVDLRVTTTVTEIDRASHQVSCAGGAQLAYDRLLIATGAQPRQLPLLAPGVAGVHYLRTLDDAERIADLLTTAAALVVIGAGWIGLEVAAAARAAGVAVTVVESAALPLLRVLGPELAQVFADLHREHDVDLRFTASVTDVLTVDGRVTGVRLGDGTTIPADAVLVAVGVRPNTDLAATAGLEVDNGILVDANLRSSDPDIFAAGDVANAFSPSLGRHIRVEHWANALKQPAHAAAAMLGGDEPYDEIPYFYTDQYDLGMEYTGYVDPGAYDRVIIRGDTTKREFIAFWLAENRVLAGMNVNVWDVTNPIANLIRSRAVVDPARLADPRQPLDQHVPSGRAVQS